MFVRRKTTPLSNKIAIQLVESVREGNKVKQKIIRHFGFALNEEEAKALERIALKYKLELESQKTPSLFDIDTMVDVVTKDKCKKEGKPLEVNLIDIYEEKRVKVGFQEVYGYIFNWIGFGKVLDRESRRKVSVNLLKHLVLARILQPASKLSSVEIIKSSFNIQTQVNSIYRMMDFIDEEAIERLQRISYRNALDLFGEEVGVIFYDCTTLYFESFVEDDLRRNGYSKDGKFNQGQVLLALMVSKEGIPIGYEVFPGNKFEGGTLESALEKIKEKYKVRRAIFVADSALLNRDNIDKMKEKGQPFIVGARTKNFNKSITQKILDRASYKPLYEDKGFNDISYQEIDIGNDLRLIVTHSISREEKDKRDREKAIERLKKRLCKSKSPKVLLNNYGYKKYVRIEGDSEVTLNEEKIKEAELWDGLHGIVTNIKDMDAKEILIHYRGLWQIEESFRISKNDLRIRPIFHWTTKRIRAHIALSFMALVCVRTLQYRIEKQYKKMSPEAIRRCLSNLEVSILKDKTTGKRYGLPSQASKEAEKIYQILGLSWQQTPFEIT